MLDLENLNLVELNAQEMKEIEGGSWLSLLFAVIFTTVSILLLD
jgi:hypothetical protein